MPATGMRTSSSLITRLGSSPLDAPRPPRPRLRSRKRPRATAPPPSSSSSIVGLPLVAWPVAGSGLPLVAALLALRRCWPVLLAAGLLAGCRRRCRSSRARPAGRSLAGRWRCRCRCWRSGRSRAALAAALARLAARRTARRTRPSAAARRLLAASVTRRRSRASRGVGSRLAGGSSAGVGADGAARRSRGSFGAPTLGRRVTAPPALRRALASPGWPRSSCALAHAAGTADAEAGGQRLAARAAPCADRPVPAATARERAGASPSAGGIGSRCRCIRRSSVDSLTEGSFPGAGRGRRRPGNRGECDPAGAPDQSSCAISVLIGEECCRHPDDGGGRSDQIPGPDYVRGCD